MPLTLKDVVQQGIVDDFETVKGDRNMAGKD